MKPNRKYIPVSKKSFKETEEKEITPLPSTYIIEIPTNPYCFVVLGGRSSRLIDI